MIVLSCSHSPARPTIPQTEKPFPKIGLVLGGGAARGFAHVGVIRVLEQEKIPIDLVVGTSVGSLIGALYADTGNSFELEWTAFQVQKDDIFDFSILSSARGPVKGERLEVFVNEKVKAKTIETMKIPFAAVATNLKTGEAVVLDKGPVGRAVRASSSIPGVFSPVIHNGLLLVDGGVVDNVPVDVARNMGAEFVIAVTIPKAVEKGEVDKVWEIVLQSINIMTSEISKMNAAGADIVIEPQVGDIGMMDFDQKKRAMEAGMEAAKAALPAIYEKLGMGSPRPIN